MKIGSAKIYVSENVITASYISTIIIYLSTQQLFIASFQMLMKKLLFSIDNLPNIIQLGEYPKETLPRPLSNTSSSRNVKVEK